MPASEKSTDSSADGLRLILMRHAKSDWSDSDASDHDRTLNDRGRRDCPAMAAWIEENGYRPDLILCSSATRTRETADAMIASWKRAPKLTIDNKLYLADPGTILETIRCEAFADDETQIAMPRMVMVLAHNPGISHAASMLASESIGLPTAALVVLRCDVESWFTPLHQDSVTLIDQMKPKSLPGAKPRYDFNNDD